MSRLLVGRLRTDPELRCTPSGEAVASFELEPDWPGQIEALRVVVWSQGRRQLAERVAERLRAGAWVCVEGRLRARPGRPERASGGRELLAEEVLRVVRRPKPHGRRSGGDALQPAGRSEPGRRSRLGHQAAAANPRTRRSEP